MKKKKKNLIPTRAVRLVVQCDHVLVPPAALCIDESFVRPHHTCRGRKDGQTIDVQRRVHQFCIVFPARPQQMMMTLSGMQHSFFPTPLALAYVSEEVGFTNVNARFVALICWSLIRSKLVCQQCHIIVASC